MNEQRYFNRNTKITMFVEAARRVAGFSKKDIAKEANYAPGMFTMWRKEPYKTAKKMETSEVFLKATIRLLCSSCAGAYITTTKACAIAILSTYYYICQEYFPAMQDGPSKWLTEGITFLNTRYGDPESIFDSLVFYILKTDDENKEEYDNVSI